MRNNNYIRLVTLFFILLPAFCPAFGQSVPFVIPGDDASPTATDFSRLLHKPAGKYGFMSVRNGKFFVGDHRFRAWGMNMCFGANFPTHEDADRIAPHLAKLGINTIRFHHMDMQDSPGGIWITHDDGTRSLDPEQVDRLDYFLAKLHENGIYANLNLHCSRTLTPAEGFSQLTNGPWWSFANKWVMYYDPSVQNELKRYCRALLTHENPYRGLRRVDDPGIAFLELLNENFFSVQGPSLLDRLPQQYVDSFKIKWNQWLLKKYRTHNTLVKSWEPKSNELTPLFESAKWTKGLDDWEVNSPSPSKTLSPKFDVTGPYQTIKGIRLEPVEVSKERHLQQISRQNFSLEKGKPYTLTFWVKSDQPREYNVEVSTLAGGDWRPLGVFELLKAKTTWTRITRTFVPDETIANEAFLGFSFGMDKTPIEFAGVTLAQGLKAAPLTKDQVLGNGAIAIPGPKSSFQAHRDLRQFMLDTEREWITEYKRYLTEDLGVKIPMTASQENYHGPGVIPDTVDFVDLHNYWHHPTFPSGRDFNPVDYRTGNDPIESDPYRTAWPARSLIMRAGWRYHDMPFTLSEWNHPEPSDVSTGAIMMAATVGAIQDWDGIYFFDYESDSEQWFNSHYEGFFDFNHQPAKLAVFSVAANIFLRGDLAPLKEKASGTFGQRLHGCISFERRIGIDTNATEPDQYGISDSKILVTPDRSVIWDAKDSTKAKLVLYTPKSIGVWGLVANQSFDIGSARFEIGKVERNYATVLLTSIDNQPIAKSNHMLLLASSGAENTDMQWNSERTSVSDNWGSGPTTINTVSAKLTLPLKQSPTAVYALDGCGKRMQNVDFTLDDGCAVIEIGNQYSTLWYEIVVDQDAVTNTNGLSLKEASKGLFKIGVGVNVRSLKDRKSLDLMRQQFDFVTPENCMKFANVQKREGEFSFVESDRFVNLARANGLNVVGHCLVWAKDDRTPEWFFEENGGPVSRDTLLNRMKDHMIAVQTRYDGKIVHWDVVNEALEEGDSVWRDSTWKKTCDLDFLSLAFETARECDPDGLLIYNDYRSELPGKRKNLFKLVEYLQSKNIPIDAVGLQGHYELDEVPYEDLDLTLNKLREYGLKVVISEVDIDVVKRGKWWADGGSHREELAKYDPYADGCPEEILKRQADQYAKLFEVYAKHSDIIERVTFWNLHDGESWLNYFPWKRSNHPLLFDRNLKQKPAYQAVIDVLSKYQIEKSAE